MMFRTSISRALVAAGLIWTGLALAASVPAPARAARLRGSTTLTSSKITIADIWDDAGRDGALVLGPSPAPGGSITVEAPQLAAIARQFGVAWRPASSADAAKLDRPGRPLARQAVVAALRAALVPLGAPDDAEIELAAYVAPILPLELAAAPEIEQCDYDAATGRFTATLAVAPADMPAIRQRVVGRTREMLELPTPTHRLVPGLAITAQDLRLTRVDAAGVRAEPVRAFAEAIGMAPRHAALAGQPIARAELMAPIVVEKGARVTMELRSPGLAVLTLGQAAESGGLGERIAVINLTSRAVIQGEIIGPGQVRVLPDSLPSLPGTTAGRGGDPQFATLPSPNRIR